MIGGAVSDAVLVVQLPVVRWANHSLSAACSVAHARTWCASSRSARVSGAEAAGAQAIPV